MDGTTRKALGMLRDKAAEQQTIKKALKETDTEDQSREP